MRTIIGFFIVSGVLLLGGCDNLFAPEPGSDPEAIFEDLWTTFDREYAGFEARGVQWSELYARHRPRVTIGTTDDDLFGVLTALLTPLDDGHVTLVAPGQQMFLSNRFDREKAGDASFDIHMIRDGYLEPGFTAGPHDAYVFGRIRGAPIGYIHLRNIAADFAMLTRMLDASPGASGYVVDLRQNRGGNHTFAFSQLGRLTDRKRYVFRSRTKNGPGRMDFTPWHEWHLEPAGPYVPKPIVVLTDRRTPSAAERTVMAFRTLPQVTVLGDTTNGSISTKIARELANGWYYTLSPQQVEMFDGVSYEGRGIAPDLVVRNDPLELQRGIDRVLEAAIERLR